MLNKPKLINELNNNFKIRDHKHVKFIVGITPKHTEKTVTEGFETSTQEISLIPKQNSISN